MMSGHTVVLIVVVALIVVAAFAVLNVVAALGEFKQERALQCSGCGRSGPFPEREVMAIREGRAAHCPDCGHQLGRWRATTTAT